MKDFKSMTDKQVALLAMHDEDAEHEWISRLEKEDETFPLTGIDGKRNIGNEWYGLSMRAAKRMAEQDAADFDNDEDDYDRED